MNDLKHIKMSPQYDQVLIIIGYDYFIFPISESKFAFHTFFFA